MGHQPDNKDEPDESEETIVDLIPARLVDISDETRRELIDRLKRDLARG